MVQWLASHHVVRIAKSTSSSPPRGATPSRGTNWPRQVAAVFTAVDYPVRWGSGQSAFTVQKSTLADSAQRLGPLC